MATYTKQDIINLKDRIRAELPAMVQANPGTRTTPLELLYCDANPALVDQFGMSNHKWSVVQVRVNDIIQELRKSGEIVKHKGKYYHPDFDLTTIPAKPTKAKKKVKKAKKVDPVVEPVVEETVVEPVEETHIPVEVDNPAVVEDHIDTETQELVENVGGSRDYRKPLDQVEDGYITSSSVQVSTTTLMPVEEETPSVEVEDVVESTPVEDVVEVQEVEVAPVEPVEVEEVVEPIVEEEDPVEDDTEDDTDEDDSQPRYDLKELRKNASFDPLNITLKGIKGRYEVYRDMEARMVVLTQKGREDYVMIPVDVDMERLEGIDPRYAKFAQQAINDFENEGNHKVGCTRMCKALLSCCKMCQHTDDFGGLVEFCIDPNCPLQNIWGGVATYVNPENS